MTNSPKSLSIVARTRDSAVARRRISWSPGSGDQSPAQIVVTGLTQGVGGPARDAAVEKNLHAADSTGKGSTRSCNQLVQRGQRAGADVVGLKERVCGDDVFGGVAGGQHRQHMLHRQAAAAARIGLPPKMAGSDVIRRIRSGSLIVYGS